MSLQKIEIRSEHLKSLAYAFEGAMLDSEDSPEAHKRMQNLFYVLYEQIEMLDKEIKETNGHNIVCNAIFAVNHVEELKSKLALLESENG